jgi:hypothetical protein
MFLPRGPNHVADILVNVLRMKGIATPTKTAAISIEVSFWMQLSHIPIVVKAVPRQMEGRIPYVSMI